MSKRPLTDPLTDSLTAVSDERRAEALRRFTIMSPHRTDGIPPTEGARISGVPLRTLSNGKPASPPRLSLGDLEATVKTFITSAYNARTHGEIDASPNDAWRGDGYAFASTAMRTPSGQGDIRHHLDR